MNDAVVQGGGIVVFFQILDKYEGGIFNKNALPRSSKPLLLLSGSTHFPLLD